MLKYHKDLDQTLKRLDKMILKWHQRENSIDTSKIMQMKSIKNWEGCNPVEHGDIDSDVVVQSFATVFKRLMKRTTSLAMPSVQSLVSESDQALRPLQYEMESFSKLADKAESDLELWECSSKYLDELKQHMDFYTNQQIYLKDHREEFLSRKTALEQSITCLNELKTFSDDSINDITDECKYALEKCDEGIEKCNSRKKSIEINTNEIGKEQERVLADIVKCEAKLSTHITNLHERHDKLQHWMVEASEILNSDAYMTQATTAGAGRMLEGMRSGGGLFGAIALAALTGGVGLAVGAAAGGAMAYTAAKEAQQTKLRRIRQCRDELQKYDEIIRKCDIEINQMREILAVSKISKDEELEIDT